MAGGVVRCGALRCGALRGAREAEGAARRARLQARRTPKHLPSYHLMAARAVSLSSKETVQSPLGRPVRLSMYMCMVGSPSLPRFLDFLIGPSWPKNSAICSSRTCHAGRGRGWRARVEGRVEVRVG